MRQINLLPETFVHQYQMTKLKARAVLWSVSLLVILIPVHLFMVSEVQRLQTVVDAPVLGQPTPELDDLRRMILSLEQEETSFISTNEALLDVLLSLYPNTSILKTFSELSENIVWLRRIELIGNEGTCLIHGRAFDTRQVSEFMLALKKQPFFDSVDLTSLEKGVGTSPKEIDFKITLNLL